MWSPYAVRLELVFQVFSYAQARVRGCWSLRYAVWQHFQPNHCDYLTAGKHFTCKASRGRSSFWYLPASCVRSSWFNIEFETVQLFVPNPFGEKPSASKTMITVYIITKSSGEVSNLVYWRLFLGMDYSTQLHRDENKAMIRIRINQPRFNGVKLLSPKTLGSDPRGNSCSVARRSSLRQLGDAIGEGGVWGWLV